MNLTPEEKVACSDDLVEMQKTRGWIWFSKLLEEIDKEAWNAWKDAPVGKETEDMVLLKARGQVTGEILERVKDAIQDGREIQAADQEQHRIDEYQKAEELKRVRSDKDLQDLLN